MAYTGPRGSGQVLLSDYLKANRQQGAQMGNALASGIEAQAGQVQGAVDAASRDYAQRIGTQQWANAPSASEAKEGMGMAEARLKKLEDGTLNEFSDVANVGALNAQAARAQDNAMLAGSQAGRGALFRQQQGVANGGYSIGNSMFDAAVATHGAGARLNQAANRTRTSLSEYVKNATGKAKSLYDSEVASAQNAKKRYEDQMKALTPAPSDAPQLGRKQDPDFGRKPPPRRLPRPDRRIDVQ